ncbi:putative rRNA methyltransferase YqxC [Candidatus Magnetomoraceae bacterium gMMP-15]
MEKGLALSRERARSLILAGKVLIENQVQDKAGTFVSKDVDVIIRGSDMPYVSRGGLKLEEALHKIPLDVSGLICMDVGASTGGFTDCLLKHGAEHVVAVDVGYGQLSWKLRCDSCVTVMERTNIRFLSKNALSFIFDLITIDTSFISLKIVIPCVMKFLKPSGMILALIKPQFEVGKGEVGKGGVVRDAAEHERVINELSHFFQGIGLSIMKVIPSPILGPKGNKEFIIFLINEIH